jgi:hypothetical protein
MLAELYPADIRDAITAIAAVTDDHTRSYHANLPGQTDESEVSAALDGDVGKHFAPTHIAIEVVSVSGAVAEDGTINIGTSSDGNEIAAALALTGLTVAGNGRIIPLAAGTHTILGNATLYVNVEQEDSTATTLVLDVRVLGRQF